MSPPQLVETDYPEEIKTWLLNQERAKLGENLDAILTQYGHELERGVFLNKQEIANVAMNLMEVEFKKGGYKKMFSKKMRARVDGKMAFKNLPLKQTAVFTELVAKDKKQVGYNFSVVNYFNTPGGYMYVIRHGIPHPVLFVFAGHFFDRLLKRGLSINDHAARMTAVFRILKYLDRMDTGLSGSIFLCAPTRQAYLAALGGLCLGVGHGYAQFPKSFDFGTDRLVSDNAHETPQTRFALLFLTYVDKEMLGKEQIYIYERLRRPKWSSD